MTTNTPIEPNVDQFPAVLGVTYRLVGAASNAVTDSEVMNLLTRFGLHQVSVWSGSPPPEPFPKDWPAEGRSVVLTGEHIVRAQGVWAGNSSGTGIPTTIRLSEGKMVVLQVWSVTGATQVNLSNTTPSSPIAPNATAVWGGILLAGGIFLAGLALLRSRKSPMMLPGTRKNPVQYQGTIQYRGVPLHVHQKDQGFCVDYTALRHYTPYSEGGTLCASSQEKAIRDAEREIDRAMPRPGSTRRKIYVD